jgi:type IV secretory pathway protease TraF
VGPRSIRLLIGLGGVIVVLLLAFRGSSDDSRFWGPVPEDWLLGRLWFVINDG